MQRLLDFPIEEPDHIEKLRAKSVKEHEDVASQIALGAALSLSGCSYEAASILRPLRKHWKLTDASAQAQAALDAQSWWKKNWREFVQQKRAGNKDAALDMLSDRSVHYWDLPPLLVHLGDIAAHEGQLELARHLYQRVYYLSQRKLPKMDMKAFEYVAQAALADILLRSGKPAEALEMHRAVRPNPGNAMAHELQFIKLLVATDTLDEAMRQAASTVITANKHRSGYGKTMRLEYIDQSPDLTPLREHNDWPVMLNDPVGYLKGS